MPKLVALRCDPSVEAVYVSIGEDRASVRQVCVGDCLIVDVGADGEAVGVEIIGATLEAVSGT